ncbi:MAG: hypothetical protein WCP07_06930 [bacterium]
MRFRILLLTVVLAGTVLLSGCGGGSSNSSDFSNISTGQNGRLEDGVLGPSGGSTFISTGTVFQLSWPGAPPPNEFGVALRRYKEARGGEDKEVSTQRIDVRREGNSNAWNIARRDNFDLDREGVYYLEGISTGSANIRKAFIVASGRAKDSRDIGTGGNGSLAGLQIFPPPGEVSIPRNTTFRISWSGSNQPPPRLGIEIVRYKEARGNEPKEIKAQAQDIKNNGNFTFDVKRRDNFLLDKDGVYFLEISAPGENTIRAAYIVDSN